MDERRPHVVFFPAPAQGHINPMMQLAKLLYSRGCFITFVNTNFSHKHLQRSQGLESLGCLDGFRFETISDGLPPTFKQVADDPAFFCKSIIENCVSPFRDLLRKLQTSSDGPHVACIISDAITTFTLKVAEELGIPEMIFCAMGACGLMVFSQYYELMRRGLVPLKDQSYLNGYFDTTINWIPGMKEMRLKDLGSFIQATDPNDFFLNYVADEAQNTLQASAIIFNSFDNLEHEVLHAFRSTVPSNIYTIGPLSLQCRSISNMALQSVKTSMWKEEPECLKWLDGCTTASVIYVNYGSNTSMTTQQLMEFAWGLANSNHPFLWVIRPDLVRGSHSMPEEFMNEIEGRGMVVRWCSQEKVLSHPATGLFLTHCGWNSTIESLSFGVPMLCWALFAEQPTNCHYICNEWGVGMQIDSKANREAICVLIKEFMEGEKGQKLRENALKWKKSAEVAIKEGGSSHNNLELLINEIWELGGK